LALTTYLPRLIAVSGYRGLREELQQGLAAFLFHSVSGLVGVPDTVIRRGAAQGNRWPLWNRP